MLVEDICGQRHMLDALSPSSIDLKPPRGADGQGIFPVRTILFSLLTPVVAASTLYDYRLPPHPPIPAYDADTSFKSFQPLDVNIRQSNLIHSLQGKPPSTPSLDYRREKCDGENLLFYTR